MNEWRTLCCLPLLLLGLAACSTLNSAAGGNTEQDARAALNWGFQRNGLRIDIDADTALNRYDNEAHTLVVAVMQTAEPTPFYQLLGNEALLHKILLNGGTPPGALHFARFAITPGRQQLIVLDRIAATQHVGVIAAYYGVSPAKTAQLFKIPV
ncbi:MAG TPA: type VI secretion lipoprotein TssJ, partial [Rhodocyclaceae bacterium]|nr:type VI secretion lipoprotein TssJ [Rhodocyclaceae bacterium]